MPTSDQVYKLLSVNSNKVLDVSGASLEDGAPVIQYTSQDSPNQQWYFKTVGSVNGQEEAYQIVNINSGKVLDVSGGSQDAGAPLQQRTPTGATSQQWYLTPLGNVNRIASRKIFVSPRFRRHFLHLCFSVFSKARPLSRGSWPKRTRWIILRVPTTIFREANKRGVSVVVTSRSCTRWFQGRHVWQQD